MKALYKVEPIMFLVSSQYFCIYLFTRFFINQSAFIILISFHSTCLLFSFASFSLPFLSHPMQNIIKAKQHNTYKCTHQFVIT